jgi:2-octaprenyl-6-methoxyphenol hydroxylase
MAQVGIIGSGPAGMIAALALAQSGHEVTLIGPPASTTDARSTAIMAPGLRLLGELGVLDTIKAATAPLQTMRIIDGTRRLLRAPVVTFHAREIGEDAFGLNVPNAFLNRTLAQALAGAGVTVQAAAANAVTDQGRAVIVGFGDGETLAFEGVVGADGKDSLCRSAAGIATRQTDLPQSALVGQFSHTRHHNFISNEFHTESGPFTTVPLPGGFASSFVWVVDPQEATRLAALDAGAISLAVEKRMESLLGAVTLDRNAAVQAWPLSGVLARSAAAGNIALIGEAAHRFPPIGAQGLNLTLRDVAELRRVLSENSSPATAFGFFATARARDMAVRYASVMALNRSLLSGLLPVQAARSAGLAMLARFPELRGFVMREGLQPGSGWAGLSQSLRRLSERQDA